MANKNPSPSTRFQKGSVRSKEMGRKGAIKANETKQFAGTFREAAIKQLDEINTAKDKTGTLVEYTAREQIMGSLIRESLKGNVRAAELLMKITGEAPTERLEVTGADGKDIFASMSTKDLKDKVDDLLSKLGKC